MWWILVLILCMGHTLSAMEVVEIENEGGSNSEESDLSFSPLTDDVAFYCDNFSLSSDSCTDLAKGLQRDLFADMPIDAQELNSIFKETLKENPLLMGSLSSRSGNKEHQTLVAARMCAAAAIKYRKTASKAQRDQKGQQKEKEVAIGKLQDAENNLKGEERRSFLSYIYAGGCTFFSLATAIWGAVQASRGTIIECVCNNTSSIT